MNTNIQSIPSAQSVRKIEPGDGEKFDIAYAHLTWKVKGATATSVCGLMPSIPKVQSDCGL